MSLFLIGWSSRPEPPKSGGDRWNAEPSAKASERVRRQAMKRVREVEASYRLEQRIFF
jgi:hypothetical protein